MKKLLFALLWLGSISAASASDKTLIYGRILSVVPDGLLVSCEPAHHSHPTGFYGFADSPNEIVHVESDPKTLIGILERTPASLNVGAPNDHEKIMLTGRLHGDYTYTTKLGIEKTVPSFVLPEAIPAYSAITTPRAAETAPATPTPWPTLPFPISPTIADLRVGITADQCRLILGNPLHVNGDQWVYARGYIYIRDGHVSSMQNKAGGVFAAEWR